VLLDRLAEPLGASGCGFGRTGHQVLA